MWNITRSSALLAVVGLCAAASALPASEGRDYLDEAVVFGETAQAAIAKWPERSKDMARVLIHRFGPPDVVEADRLSWRDKHPWKRIVVFREPRPLDRPGILQQSVAYDVPVGRWRELIAFERGVVFDAVRRELTACSDSVETNFLALNLAEEVIRGRRSAEQARVFYDKTVALSFAGKSSPYMSRLLFRFGRARL